VALAEQSAEVVSFRWQQPNIPPAQNVNSADCSLNPACHFGGKSAKAANFVKNANLVQHSSPLIQRRVALPV
jgi:hypothetical protein